MSTDTPDTIVLVHGLWVTPRSWEEWKAHYEAKGYTVITPAYPGFEIEVEALRENTDVIANLTVPETVEHLAGVIEALPAPPIIMGHSFGGLLTQMLLAAGSALRESRSTPHPPRACASRRCRRRGRSSPR